MDFFNFLNMRRSIRKHDLAQRLKRRQPVGLVQTLADQGGKSVRMGCACIQFFTSSAHFGSRNRIEVEQSRQQLVDMLDFGQLIAVIRFGNTHHQGTQGQLCIRLGQGRLMAGAKGSEKFSKHAETVSFLILRAKSPCANSAWGVASY